MKTFEEQNNELVEFDKNLIKKILIIAFIALCFLLKTEKHK